MDSRPATSPLNQEAVSTPEINSRANRDQTNGLHFCALHSVVALRAGGHFHFAALHHHLAVFHATAVSGHQAAVVHFAAVLGVGERGSEHQHSGFAEQVGGNAELAQEKGVEKG